MNMSRIIPALILMAGTLHAEELSRQLPKQTAWVRYHMTEKWDDGTERTYQFEIHLFGPTITEKQSYRWIELKIRDDASKGWNILKWQISEDDLKRGGAALSNSRRAWRKRPDGQPKQFHLDELFARLYLFSPPPLEGAKLTGEKESIDWQQGKMECEIATVRKKDKFLYDEADTVYQLKLNRRVPLGVAGAVLTVTDSTGTKGTIEYSLLDMGENAKSEIPNAK